MSDESRQAVSVPEAEPVIRPRWRDVGWAVLGLAADWRCASEWFAGKTSFYSKLVLGTTVLTVLVYVGVALLTICFSRTARWREAPGVFGVISLSAYYFVRVVWFVTRGR
jgi:hypothetical protein